MVINSGQIIKFEVMIEGVHDIQNCAAVLVYHLKGVCILNILQEYWYI
jgi:hypothetical protein